MSVNEKSYENPFILIIITPINPIIQPTIFLVVRFSSLKISDERIRVIKTLVPIITDALTPDVLASPI